MARKREHRTPGKVDYENLASFNQKPARFRILQNEKTREIVRIFGYSVGTTLWVGYPALRLHEAPCTHCGQLAFGDGWAFGPNPDGKFHLCPGHLGRDSLGNVVPCNHDGMTADDGSHVCDGRPSMSYHGTERWTALNGWTEIVEKKT